MVLLCPTSNHQNDDFPIYRGSFSNLQLEGMGQKQKKNNFPHKIRSHIKPKKSQKKTVGRLHLGVSITSPMGIHHSKNHSCSSLFCLKLQANRIFDGDWILEMIDDNESLNLTAELHHLVETKKSTKKLLTSNFPCEMGEMVESKKYTPH